jgi:hypothetical protein
VARPRTPPALKEIEDLAARFEAQSSARKLLLLKRLEDARLPTASAVKRLHEVLLFLRAYPDDQALLSCVERMLAVFEDRPDLRAQQAALANSGIAGTAIDYAFYLPTARWLARRYPGRLHVDWETLGSTEPLMQRLWLLLPSIEEYALERFRLGLRKWVGLLKGADETDAEFLVRRIAALRAGQDLREVVYDALDIPLRLEAGRPGPSRTLARLAASRPHFQTVPLDTTRPDLRAEIRRPPLSVQDVSRKKGQELIDLAREAMVTRSRDLDAFMHGDPRDVRLVDCGDGLQFAAIGTLPERRLLLEAVYGFLTIKNGIPIGYVLASGFNRSSEVAYNIFEPYRGGEAGQVYGRVLGMVHHLLGSTVFVVDPYQLGHGNQEGLASGAWWFYFKLGFRPRNPAILQVLQREEERMAKNPRHRSTEATLKKLSADYLYYFDGRPREDVLGLLDLGAVGMRVSRYLARRFGADREEGLRTCAAEAAHLLGVSSMKSFSPSERAVWRQWAPLVLILPRVRRWGAASKEALVALIRAKGGAREADYLPLLNAHMLLRRGLSSLAKPGDDLPV